ncbi:MAG: hypothetical protein ACE5EI_10740, partial [Thermodesulfobacteriota bacterium]
SLLDRQPARFYGRKSRDLFYSAPRHYRKDGRDKKRPGPVSPGQTVRPEIVFSIKRSSEVLP